MTGELIALYRPVGPGELELLAASGCRRRPPRLPEQSIFYPVTNEQHAREITIKWNVSEHGAGCVTRFFVRKSFIDQYPVHQVGAGNHTEWWIPAGDLEMLNDNIVGLIQVIEAYGDPALINRIKEKYAHEK